MIRWPQSARVRRALYGAAIAAGWITIGAEPHAGARNATRRCLSAGASSDSFPDKVTVDDATGFRVAYHRTYKVVSVRQVFAGGPAETYVLVQCGTTAPPLAGALAGAQVVPVPVRSLYAAAPTHLAALRDLARQDVVTGVARRSDLTGDGAAIWNQPGRVQEFSRLSVIDAERVVEQRPGLLMTSGVPGAGMDVIRRGGVPVIADTDWLETTPLGRAEWIKFVALFLNEERAAQDVYAAMKSRYVVLRAVSERQPVNRRPLVMTGRSTRGRFTIAGGRSYVAALIREAGGRYAWADDTSTGTAVVDLEQQLARAADADIWINGGGWSSLSAMLDDEPRYAVFKAYRQHQVWVYERRQTATGSNDYWSRGATHPDVVLRDLQNIFHPHSQPGARFEWYMPVPVR